MKDVMTPSEVATLIGLSRDTVMRYIACGRIRGNAIAGKTRKRYVVTRENLQDYLDSNETQPAALQAPSTPRFVRTATPMLDKYGYKD